MYTKFKSFLAIAQINFIDQEIGYIVALMHTDKYLN